MLFEVKFKLVTQTFDFISLPDIWGPGCYLWKSFQCSKEMLLGQNLCPIPSSLSVLSLFKKIKEKLALLEKLVWSLEEAK